METASQSLVAPVVAVDQTLKANAHRHHQPALILPVNRVGGRHNHPQTASQSARVAEACVAGESAALRIRWAVSSRHGGIDREMLTSSIAATKRLSAAKHQPRLASSAHRAARHQSCATRDKRTGRLPRASVALHRAARLIFDINRPGAPAPSGRDANAVSFADRGGAPGGSDERLVG